MCYVDTSVLQSVFVSKCVRLIVVFVVIAQYFTSIFSHEFAFFGLLLSSWFQIRYATRHLPLGKAVP